MRPTPLPAMAALVVVAAQYSDESLKQLSHPPSSSASTCDSNTCTRPSSGGGERLEANAATILIILLCALICAIALNIGIRCSLRHNSHRLETQAQQEQQQQHVRKPDMQDVEVQPPPSPTTLIFSVGMKLAGEEAECAICLSEFVEGEGIRILDKCGHGFHVHCIQKWLSSHSSCPTCRASCLPSLSVSDEESGTTSM